DVTNRTELAGMADTASKGFGPSAPVRISGLGTRRAVVAASPSGNSGAILGGPFVKTAFDRHLRHNRSGPARLSSRPILARPSTPPHASHTADCPTPPENSDLNEDSQRARESS